MSADQDGRVSKEKRRTKRRPLLESFSMFAVIPRKGVHRLPIYDISDLGVGFDFDIEGESLTDFPVTMGERLELHFYMNQSLYLPLSVQVARVETRGVVRRIGSEFVDKENKNYKAFLSFVHFLDALMDAGVLRGMSKT